VVRRRLWVGLLQRGGAAGSLGAAGPGPSCHTLRSMLWSVGRCPKSVDHWFVGPWIQVMLILSFGLNRLHSFDQDCSRQCSLRWPRPCGSFGQVGQVRPALVGAATPGGLADLGYCGRPCLLAPVHYFHGSFGWSHTIVSSWIVRMPVHGTLLGWNLHRGAKVGAVIPLGAAVPTICGPLLRNRPLILLLQIKTQHNSWNLVST
jgi:hypothetical protein